MVEVTCRLLRDLPSPCADKKPRSTWDIGVSMQILKCSDLFSFETKISMMKLPGQAAATTGLTARPSTVPALVRLCSGIIHRRAHPTFARLKISTWPPSFPSSA